MRKHIDWNDCMVLVLNGLAYPYNWIPYSRAGRIIDLYIVILFVGDNYNFKMSLRRYSLELTDLRFCLGCALHVKRLSNVNPRYSTSFAGGTTLLLNMTETKRLGQFSFDNLNDTRDGTHLLAGPAEGIGNTGQLTRFLNTI